MKIVAARESAPLEARVAITPDSAKKFIALGAEVVVQSGAGTASGISDDAYATAGAKIAASIADTYAGADVILCVDTPNTAAIEHMPNGAVLIGMLNPLGTTSDFASLNARSIHAYAMELLPRISRAQAMDVLSSQSNLAGYRAVMEAVAVSGKAMPMMMTAAGTVTPAKVLVLGAGVAGLQAIATAKRLGAVVSAFDVRPVVKEQVESLGAKFVEVKADANAETSGGYAKEMDAEYKARQEAALAAVIPAQDIIISTALIPGRPAPELITAAMLASMKAGSVIVDLAAASGGNCKQTKRDELIHNGSVPLIGYTDLPSRVAADASPLYARNLFNFVSTLMMEKGSTALAIKSDDELIKGTLVLKGGQAVHAALTNQ